MDPNFLTSIVTGDKSWCFQYNPLTKCQLCTWLSLGVPRPQKVRQQKSKVKSMLITYFDAKGLIHHEHVPLNETVNAAYYIEILKFLKHRIQHIWSEYREPRLWSLLIDNAPAHSANIVKHYFAESQIPNIKPPPLFAWFGTSWPTSSFSPSLKCTWKDDFLKTHPPLKLLAPNTFKP